MMSRERVVMALAHEEPDRPPVFATYTPEAEHALRRKAGNSGDLGVMLGNDMVKATVGMECSYYASELPTYECKWGLTWQNIKNSTGEYTEIIKQPLQGDHGDILAEYEIPDPLEETQYDKVREAVAQYGKTHFVVGSCQCSIFETAWYLRGMEDFLCDLMMDDGYADALLDKIMTFPLRAGQKMIDLGVDMIWLGDDVATQIALMMSPELWRKYLKPRYAKLFDEFRKKRKSITIAYHSCGNCEAIIDDMLEIGLDVLNPIQPLSIDPIRLKNRYGKSLTLFGGLDVQHVLPFGTPEEVRTEVHRLKTYCGKGGGYILSPAHHIQSDTPLQNVLAFYGEALKSNPD